jgi:hypothetical protein
VERKIIFGLLGALLVACDSADDPVAPSLAASEVAANGAETAVPIFTGRGTSIDATVRGLNTKLCDAGPMLTVPSGRFELREPSGRIAELLTTLNLECFTAGIGNKAVAEASVENLNLTIGEVTITAERLHAMVNAFCVPGQLPRSQGHTVVRGLRINGKPVDVLNIPNQRINLPNGFIILRDEISFATPFHAGRTLIALRLVITLPERIADIAITRTQGHIDCP